MDLELLQKIATGGFMAFAAWAAFGGKKADSHISDNQTFQEMFKTQAQLIEDLRGEVAALKKENKLLQNQLREFKATLVKKEQ